jgi:hypothetical protein
MTDNQFDNFFREKLINHTAPVPEGLWEKIRPEKEKRPKGFFLRNINGTGLLLAALLVGTVIIGTLTYQRNTSVPATDAKLNIPNTNSTNTNSTTTNQLSGNISTLNSTKSNNNIAKDSKIEISKDPAVQTIAKNNLSPLNQLSILKNTPIKEPQSNISNSVSFISNEQPDQSLEKISADYSMETMNYAFANIQPASLLFQPSSIHSVTGTVQKNLAANGHDKFIKSTIIICPTNRSRSDFNRDWSFELFASPDYSLKSVSNVSASQQYLDKKDSTEQMQIGYSAGFRIVKPLNNNWLLKTGLQYSQINQKFSYRNENEIKTTTVITTRSIIRSPGDTIIVTDTSSLQQIGYSVKTIRNHYRSIDIPLTLGYQFGNEDITVGINAGVVFNISSWYQGELLDTSLMSVPMSKISNSYYRSNIGMGLYSSISVLKRINENTHLFFEPYFRYNLSNMTNAASPYNQRFQVGGLAIGLRFDLNR